MVERIQQMFPQADRRAILWGPAAARRQHGGYDGEDTGRPARHGEPSFFPFLCVTAPGCAWPLC